MSTLNEAKMPSLKDKIIEQAESIEKELIEEVQEEKKGKGRRIKSKSKK